MIQAISGGRHAWFDVARLHRGTHRLVLTIALLTVVVGLNVGSAAAITTISQGYLTNDSVALGSIVSLVNNTSDYVKSAQISNVSDMLGIVVDDGNTLLTLTSGQANQVQVATSGVVPVLVSTINGSINQGDQITASPIAGVGMKATSNVKVIGIAQAALASSSNNSQQTYTDKKGQKHTIILGEVPVLVGVAFYYKQPDKTIIPAAIQNVADALAGKSVNTLPIVISAAIFFVAIIIVMTIIYSMIRSSIISVGRNPMAQGAVYRNVVQMSALVLAILGVAVVSIYFILTRF